MMTQRNGTDWRKKYIVKPQGWRHDPLPTKPIEIKLPKKMDPPPVPPRVGNLLIKSLPLMFMAAVVVGSITVSQTGFGSGSLYIMTMFSSLFSGLIGSGYQWWQYRQEQAKYRTNELQREESYHVYLLEKEDDLKLTSQRQSQILWERNPPVTEMIKRAQAQQNQLWDRLSTDSNFLATRIGTADAPLCVPVHLPPIDEEDKLAVEAANLYQQYLQVHNVPFVADLNLLATIGLRGRDRDSTIEIAYSLMVHLLTHHSPEVVRVYVISHHGDAPRSWGWIKWLPHARGEGNEFSRNISFAPETDDELMAPISQQLRKRIENPYQRSSPTFANEEPHTILVFDSVRDLRRHQAVNILLGHQPGWDANHLHTSAIFIGDSPPQVHVNLEIKGNTLEYRARWASDGEPTAITCKPERTNLQQMEDIARLLAPLRLEGGHRVRQNGAPPNIRLVELLGATQPLNVDLNALYEQAYDPMRVMAFPIGINQDARMQTIILREGGQDGYGHHLMLAGGTGGGKSVTLLSIVLSLAANFPPTQLNFVLADFKAGPSELARLKQLPHVVGFVDDLESNENESDIERFRLALQGELTRRQHIFEETPQKFGRQLQNIYEYNKVAPESMLPHLVIVIDEFANGMRISREFKETIEKQIASLGRALGVHLILSTQKAADFMSVRPHVEVRMSMKLNTPEESRAIFARDDAARKLTRAGQALLQVGDNQIFEMLQVARADTPFQDDASRIDLLDDFTIYQVLADGHREVLYQHKMEEPLVGLESHEQLSEAEILVEHIRLHCEGRYPSPHVICLPPLVEAQHLPLGSLLSEEDAFSIWQQKSGWKVENKQEGQRLKVPVGLQDLPLQQEQRPYFLDLTDGDGHLVVSGTAGSGKMITLQTIILALAYTHSPNDLCFDFINRRQGLSAFADLPHCRAMTHANDFERIGRLLSLLAQEAERRGQHMRDFKVTSMKSLRTAHPDLILPSLVIVFDDFAGFVAENPQHLDTVSKLITSGKEVDIHFVFSVYSFQSTHARLLGNSWQRLGLGAKSGSETMAFLGQRGKPLREVPGRGYVLEDGELVEVQVAAPLLENSIHPDLSATVAEIQDWITAVNETWSWPDGTHPLPAVTGLPTYLEIEALWRKYANLTGSYADVQTAVLGLDYDTLHPIQLNLNRLNPYNLVVGPSQSGKTNFLSTLCLSVAMSLAPTQIDIYLFAFDQARTPIHSLRKLPHVQFANSPAYAQKLLSQLEGILETRSSEQQAYDEHQADLSLDTYVESTRIFPKRTLILIDNVYDFSRHDDLNKHIDRCMQLGRSSGIFLFLADKSTRINQIRQNFSAPAKYVADACKFGDGISFSLDAADVSLLNLASKLKGDMLNFHRPLMGKGRGIMTRDGVVNIVQIGRLGEQELSPTQYEAALKRLVNKISEPYGVADGEGEEES